MGAAATVCKTCCDTDHIEAQPSLEPAAATDEGEGLVGLWEEVVPHSRGPHGALGSPSLELHEVPTKALGGVSVFGNSLSAGRGGGSGSRGPLCLSFKLTGSKEMGVDLQLLLAPQPPALVVARVDPEGQLAVAADGVPGLCPGDLLDQVQGLQGSPDELLAQLSSFRGSSALLQVHLRQRPPGFLATLVRAGPSWRRLGISVALRQPRTCMLVAAVHEGGLVAQWNAENKENCVCVGDRISAVGECHSDAFHMYAVVQATSKDGVLQLRIEPPPRAAVRRLEVWARQVQGLAASGDRSVLEEL